MNNFSWVPNENQTDQLLNIGKRTLFLTPEKETNFSFPIEHLVSILNTEVVKTIIQIEKDDDDIISKLKEIAELNQELKKRVI
jgi:predicted AlkP superfamily phosphohydrolase/phosphomutase